MLDGLTCASSQMCIPEGRVPLVHHGSNSLLDHQVALFPAALALHPTASAQLIHSQSIENAC